MRNNDNFVTLARRTVLYSKSFIPSSVALWNDLSQDMKESASLNVFKSNLKRLFKPPVVPDFFFIGERKFSVYHARIRNHCSNLNADLFQNHLRDTPTCQCGFRNENAEHFFRHCNIFQMQRTNLFAALRQFLPISTDTFLFGNTSLSTEENTRIFTEVQQFIKLTKRFDN